MLISVILFLFHFLASPLDGQENVLRVTIQETESDRGKILVLVFDQEEGFPDQVEMAVRKFAIAPTNGKAQIELSDLPPGKYAFTVLHDEDDNEVMNTSLLGLPTEKYGFSNNPKIYFSPPSFEKAAISFGSESKNIEISLR